MTIIKQVNLGKHTDYNSKILKSIAQHFEVSNSKAAYFALYWIHEIEGNKCLEPHKWRAKAVKTVFLEFTDENYELVSALMRIHGVSFPELCKRSFLEVHKQIINNQIEPYHPKVLEFFK